MRLPEYCERGTEGLWAEPLNALTNAAFLMAAWLAWRTWRSHPDASWKGQPDIGALILLVAVIGIGSLLWHTVATPWAYLLDAGPIVIFIHVFFASFLWRIAGLSWPGLVAGLALYQAATFATLRAFPAGALNESVGYFPVLLFLLLMAGWLYLRDHALWKRFLACSGLFALSLGFRIADLLYCTSLPMGTHFLWHLNNGALLYLLLQGLIQHGMTRHRHC
jgi:hypothetical protein